MKTTILIAIVLALVVLAGNGQNRLLATKTAPKAVKAVLYYPGTTPPESIDLPVEFGMPAENWDWSVKDNCLQYHVGKDENTFCGTFKIVRSYE